MSGPPSLDTVVALHPFAVLAPGRRMDAARRYFEHHLQPLPPPTEVPTAHGRALIRWQRQPWDTGLLGMECGRLDFILAEAPAARASALDAVLEEVGREGVRYFVARIDAGDLEMVHAMEERGFVTVDGLLTFSRRISPADVQRAQVACRPAGESDIPRLRELGSRIFRFDRFHADAAIPPERADALHADWLERSVRGKAAEFVLVHEAEGLVQGFVTCAVDREVTPYLGSPLGTMELVGTAPEAAGRGVARGLIRAALGELLRRGVALAQVGTQMRNHPASRAYESCGFRLIASSLTLRKMGTVTHFNG